MTAGYYSIRVWPQITSPRHPRGGIAANPRLAFGLASRATRNALHPGPQWVYAMLAPNPCDGGGKRGPRRGPVGRSRDGPPPLRNAPALGVGHAAGHPGPLVTDRRGGRAPRVSGTRRADRTPRERRGDGHVRSRLPDVRGRAQLSTPSAPAQSMRHTVSSWAAWRPLWRRWPAASTRCGVSDLVLAGRKFSGDSSACAANICSIMARCSTTFRWSCSAAAC